MKDSIDREKAIGFWLAAYLNQCLKVKGPVGFFVIPWAIQVHGILQARILEWVAFSFSRNVPNPGIEPRSLAFQADSLLAESQVKPKSVLIYS